MTHRIRLPDSPGPRRNSKPRERYGIVKDPPWNMPGYLYVLKDDGKCWWVLKSICKPK